MSLFKSIPIRNEGLKHIDEVEAENPQEWDSVPKKMVPSDTKGNEIPWHSFLRPQQPQPMPSICINISIGKSLPDGIQSMLEKLMGGKDGIPSK